LVHEGSDGYMAQLRQLGKVRYTLCISVLDLFYDL
jgi:hypothetical protein